jgi:hypothetical protein
MTDLDKKDVARHILPTASNLLGFCFVVLSFIKAEGLGDETFIDELSAAAVVLFTAAAVFSYMSMRMTKAWFYEQLADAIFIGGLFFLSVISIVLIIGIIH